MNCWIIGLILQSQTSIIYWYAWDNWIINMHSSFHSVFFTWHAFSNFCEIWMKSSRLFFIKQKCFTSILVICYILHLQIYLFPWKKESCLQGSMWRCEWRNIIQDAKMKIEGIYSVFWNLWKQYNNATGIRFGWDSLYTPYLWHNLGISETSGWIIAMTHWLRWMSSTLAPRSFSWFSGTFLWFFCSEFSDYLFFSS